MTVASMSPIDAGHQRQACEAAVQTSLPWPLKRLPAKYRSLFYSSDIAALVRRGGWDLVHIHNPMPALEMARIASACVATGTPYVVSTHGFNEVANGEAVYKFGAIRKQVWRTCMSAPLTRVVRDASAIFALSTADTAIVRGFGFSGPIVIVPNGVDVPRPLSAKALSDVCERTGVLPAGRFDGPTFMFLANHTPNKGLDILLEAFSRVTVPYQLIVAGEPRQDVDYGTCLNGSRTDQRFILTGRLSDADVSALLQRSDIFVFPTRADTFPLVVLEAMAHGCAIIASDVGGIPYQVDPASGVLARAGDVPAFTDAIMNFCRNRRDIVQMGRDAAKRAENKFSWATSAATASEGYHRVLDRFHPDRSRRAAAPTELRTRALDYAEKR